MAIEKELPLELLTNPILVFIKYLPLILAFGTDEVDDYQVEKGEYFCMFSLFME